MTAPWAVAAVGREGQGRAERLARLVGRPLVEPHCRDFPFLLLVEEAGLALQATGRGVPGPLRIDFTDGRMRRRLATTGVRSPLARALGLKSAVRPQVVDATAGLGQDAFVLAALGCRPILLERAMPLYLLLDDALERARQAPATGAIAQTMTLHRTDAVSWLEESTEAVEVVYLDPMYPARKKQALSAKGMQLLQRLLGEECDDGRALLAAALERARRRVVVKRPTRAGPLGGEPPNYSVSAPKTRYDVYLTAS